MKKIILKTDRDKEIFADALINSPAPNEALIKAQRLNQIKKALYKEKPVATSLARTTDGELIIYQTKTSLGIHMFEVHPSDMGNTKFESEMPAQLLIRWLV